jgi:Tol biopolymer transport system component
VAQTQRAQPSPDGRFIAYDVPEGEAGSPLEIFLLAADGSQEVVLRNPANDSFPLWSPDGSRLVFLSESYRKQCIVDSPDQGRTAECTGIADQNRRRLD